MAWNTAIFTSFEFFCYNDVWQGNFSCELYFVLYIFCSDFHIYVLDYYVLGSRFVWRRVRFFSFYV